MGTKAHLITQADRVAMAVRCGLDPLGPERRREMLGAYPEPVDWDRCTGRTTLAMMSALVAAERGRSSFFMVPTFGMVGPYQRRVDALARAAGVPCGPRGVFVAADADELRGYADVAVFCDHKWYEFASPAERMKILAIEATAR